MTTRFDPEQTEWLRAAMQRHEGQLLRYAASITGDVERARDVVQDTFLRLCAQPQARLDGHVTEWLFTVCRNRALDVSRKESRMKPLTDTQLAVCESADPSPAAAAEQADATHNMRQILETLPPNQQEVVRLKFQNGLSYREISNVTKLSITNVGFLLHTAIKTMRRQMQALEGVTDEI